MSLEDESGDGMLNQGTEADPCYPGPQGPPQFHGPLQKEPPLLFFWARHGSGSALFSEMYTGGS